MRLCEFTWSDGEECLKPAVNYMECLCFRQDIAEWDKVWLCAEHYDGWADYYQRVAQGDFYNTDDARRVCRRNRL